VRTLKRPDGTERRYVLLHLFEAGDAWKGRTPTLAERIARKDALAEDLATALFLGDGDRHLGNLRVLEDGRLFGYDYGLADLYPTHH
jgi:hypothetical protein